MWNLVKEIGNKKDLEGKTIEDVNIKTAEEIFKLKHKNIKGGWTANVALIAVQYLYDIKLSNLTDDEQEKIGRHSTGIFDDAWSVFANTKNMFGYDMNTDGIFR